MGDPVTLAIIGLQVGSGIAGAAGDAKAVSFKASEAATAARYGKIAAAETDTGIREELRSVVGNIRAIRASSGISPDSPTTAAIVANEGRISERQRRIQVNNINAQVTSDQNSSAFLTQSAKDTFLYGTLGSFGKGLGSLASL